MPYSKEFFTRFSQNINLSEESQEAYNRVCQILRSNKENLNEYRSIFDECKKAFFERETVCNNIDKLTLLAKKINVSEYTLFGAFVIHGFEITEKEYIRRGIPMSVFWNTAKDFKYKNRECIANKGVAGIFVLSWYAGILNAAKFALGRFQYVLGEFPRDFTTSCGMEIKMGTPCLHVHIPSSKTPITDDVRMDSYKKAYEFYKDVRQGDCILLVCHSWLLDPTLEEILPETSNIVKFMKDFEIMMVEEQTAETYNNAWRIFGPAADGDIKDWPENTSMQRAIKKHFSEGKKLGVGEGVIVFDGEKIVR